ncbi:hypothetical protein FGO68_gene10446 [Halteria grandinella]|uniref:TRP C-terminal domain-containing protein n=1 Tax=Halteria grandinella TaxID=5974 RepID=A0A8J8P6B9_HALGN|nr:hypothetical protein FGO68_gene10446 [Halteria grandinella]
MKYGTVGDIIGLIISASILIITPYSIIIFVRVLNRASKERKLQATDFLTDYGILLDGVNLKTTIGLYWNVFVQIRWVLTIGIIVALRDYNQFQIMLLFILNNLTIFLMIYGRPFAERHARIMAYINEYLISVYLCLLFCLTDYNSANLCREEIAFCLLSTVFATVVANGAYTLGQIVQLCYLRVKKRISKSQQYKQKKYIQAENITQPQSEPFSFYHGQSFKMEEEQKEGEKPQEMQVRSQSNYLEQLEEISKISEKNVNSNRSSRLLKIDGRPITPWK